ncbi:MAG: tetratricopeptide repeat protein [Patescibacteria group bacterium]|jgi:tetratricopeptide (TPR) repeat protein
MLKEKIVKICDLFIEYGILAIVFFIPITVDFTMASYNVIDLYRIVIFRVILVFMLLSFMAKVFINGKFNYRGGAKIFLLASFLLISFFLSSLASLHPTESFWGSFSRQQGFYNLFNYLLFFILLILNLKDFKQLRRVVISVIAAASLTAVYGLLQYLNLDPLTWSRNINAARIFSTLGQPNFFGHWLIIVMPFSLYALIFIAKRILVKFFLGLALFMQLVCLILTYSRAAWLGFLSCLFFLIIVWLFYKRFNKIALGFIALTLIGVISVISLNFIRPTESAGLKSIGLVNRLASIIDFKGGSNKMRLYYLDSAIKEIRQADYLRLFIGYGPEVLNEVFMKYYQIDWGIYEAINSSPDRVHNWLFDQILSFGALGLIANLLFFIYFIYRAAIFLLAKQKFELEDWLLVFLFSSLVAYFINNFFSFSLFTVSVYLYLILALSWFIINFNKEAKVINISLTAFSKILIWIALFLVSAVFIYANNLNQVRAEIYYIKALNSVKASDCQGVINNMEKVVKLSPNNIYYQENYLFLVLNCFSEIKDISIRKRLSDNILEYIKSIRDKKSYGILHNIARVYTSFGFYLDKSYYAEAEKIFNDLMVNFPYFTGVYEDLSKQKIIQGDYKGAIEVFNKALKILPPTDHPYLNNQHRQQIIVIAVRLYEGAGQAYFKIKNYDLALEYYKKGLSLDPYRVTLYKNIADVYYVQDKLDEAIRFNRRGMMLAPSDYNWPLALSLLYRDKKDLIAAKKYLDQAIKLAPKNEELKKYYGELNN